jgi:hypothetical protein
LLQGTSLYFFFGRISASTHSFWLFLRNCKSKNARAVAVAVAVAAKNSCFDSNRRAAMLLKPNSSLAESAAAAA